MTRSVVLESRMVVREKDGVFLNFDYGMQPRMYSQVSGPVR